MRSRLACKTMSNFWRKLEAESRSLVVVRPAMENGESLTPEVATLSRAREGKGYKEWRLLVGLQNSGGRLQPVWARMTKHHSADMRRGTSSVGMTDERVSMASPRGAGDTVSQHPNSGVFGATRAGNQPGNVGARSGTRDDSRPGKVP
jgi:hypothetical protein